MKSAKRGQKVPSGLIVKSKPNRRAIAIAVALALVGTITYVFAYQYTHSAKLEVELNNKESQLQKIQQLHQDSLNSSEQEQKQLEDKIKQLEADLQAKKEREAQSIAFATKQAQASSVKVTGSCVEWMVQAGIPVTNSTTSLIIKESGCRPTAKNARSGACGIPQALPCSKLENACPNWQNDPVCQLRWMNTYVQNRYGSWDSAYSTWLSRSPHWY